MKPAGCFEDGRFFSSWPAGGGPAGGGPADWRDVVVGGGVWG